MGMDLLWQISKRVVFSLAVTFLPLMLRVTMKKFPVQVSLPPEEQRVAALKDRPFGA
jgi:hypothetical protein